MAVLDTLFPRYYLSPPNDLLTESVLCAQRNFWLRCIRAVETSGREVLYLVETAGRRPDDVNSWPAFRDIIDMYMTQTTEMIDMCKDTRKIG